MISFAVNQQAGKKIPLPLWRQWLGKIEKNLKSSRLMFKLGKNRLEISIALVDDAAIKKLNQRYRGKKGITDVLSFGEIDSPIKLNLEKPNYLGEIIICYPQAARQARAAKHSVSKELELLLVHGFLHLLGYDHEKPKETKVMRQLERRVTKTIKHKNNKVISTGGRRRRPKWRDLIIV